MVLLQDRLDVLNKKRSNLFTWRGQFTPDFVEYILESFTQSNDRILDPFSGSGTVLQQAARLNLHATGLEINPAAYLMSDFFQFCNLSHKKRIDFCENFGQKLRDNSKLLTTQRLFTNNINYREAYAPLIQFTKEFQSKITTHKEKTFFSNLLFLSEKDKKLTLRESISKSFTYLETAIVDLPYTDSVINAFLMDARMAGDKFHDQIDFILTSPPYINVFNYHQNYRAIVETFNYDILKVAHSEFGSNRKNRGNRFRTVIQYCIDMDLSIRAIWKALKEGKQIVLVLGKESNVRGIPFYNGQLIIEILKSSGGFSDIHRMERKFINKFGLNIKEDIIIATKSNKLNKEVCGKLVALGHLEESLKRSTKPTLDDIKAAIMEINQIEPSPILNPENIILNV